MSEIEKRTNAVFDRNINEPHIVCLGDLEILSRQLERELDHVTKHRDNLELSLTAAINSANERQIEAMEYKQQRDALAEALRECREDSMELLGERDWWKNCKHWQYVNGYAELLWRIENADKALSSLKNSND